MKRLLRLALATAAIGAGFAASAATYYVSDCQPGAAAGCVAGNDANAGTSAAAPWKTTAKVKSTFASMAAGSQILFARGGVWRDASMANLQNLNSRAAAPIVFDSYAPAWGGSAKPILVESRAGNDVIALVGGGTVVHDEGYVIRNLELRGEGTGEFGIFLTNDVTDVVIDNVTIDGLSIGVYCGEYDGGKGGNRITLKNSTLTNISHFGSLWGCANGLIDGNSFDSTGYATPVFDHPLYLGSEHPSMNVIVRNNSFTRSSQTNGICVSTIIVAHGLYDGLVIENNTIYQAPDTAGDGCWGITPSAAYGSAELLSNLVIRGNRVVNAGGIAVGCSSCPGALIENNVIVYEGAKSPVAVQIPAMRHGADDAADGNAIVRNNSVYYAQTARDTIAISIATTEGSGWRVESNLIYFGAPSNASHYCFDTTGLAAAGFAKFDNNLCHHAGGNGRYSFAYATLANAKAAGFDTAQGSSANPLLAVVPSSANNWSMALMAASPALAQGIGAFTSTVVDRLAPAAPTGLVVR